jgi:hypothetical protein
MNVFLSQQNKARVFTFTLLSNKELKILAVRQIKELKGIQIGKEAVLAEDMIGYV